MICLRNFPTNNESKLIFTDMKLVSEAYPEPCQSSKIARFAKIVKG